MTVMTCLTAVATVVLLGFVVDAAPHARTATLKNISIPLTDARCSVIRRTGPVPDTLTPEDVDNVLRAYADQLSKIMKRGNVCFKFYYDEFAWPLNVTQFYYRSALSTKKAEDFYRSTSKCLVTNVRFVPIIHRLHNNDEKFTTGIVAHADYYGDVHINSGLRWFMEEEKEEDSSEDYVDVDDDGSDDIDVRTKIGHHVNNNDVAQSIVNSKAVTEEDLTKMKFYLNNTVPHEILHTIGVDHVSDQGAIMNAFYQGDIHLENYNLSNEEQDVMHQQFGLYNNSLCTIK